MPVWTIHYRARVKLPDPLVIEKNCKTDHAMDPPVPRPVRFPSEHNKNAAHPRRPPELMDKPTWNDTLRAALGSCVPCLACSSSSHTGGNPDSDDEHDETGVHGVRRARSDELEGLLRDSSSASGDEGWRDDDAAADADAISLHSHLGARGRRRPPPRTPRHIALWGFNLFGAGKRGVALEGGDEALHPSRSAARTSNPNASASTPNPHPNPNASASDATAPTKTKRRGSTARTSTSDLLARAALEASPTPLQDVTEADVERRARRKARKEMRRLAAALAAEAESPSPSPSLPEDGAVYDGLPHGAHPHPHLAFHPAPSPTGHRGIPSPFMNMNVSPPQGQAAADADALAHLAQQDDEDAADLDGISYARLAPRSKGGSQSASRSSGRSSGSGSGSYAYSYTQMGAPQQLEGLPPPKPKKRSKKSKSSATSSTLASLSPPPSASAFALRGERELPPSPPYHPSAYVRSSPSPLSGARSSPSPLSAAKEDEFGAFASVGAGGEDEFDGTPGGLSFPPPSVEEEEFGGVPGGLGVALPPSPVPAPVSPGVPSSPDVSVPPAEADAEDAQAEDGEDEAEEAPVPREALPAPGLSRRASNAGFSGMGGF
ncbi:hypothetical protein DFH06DRAFT_1307113 [Mycena polygramma]|nr:hypothetical protein DFH06DRAFT_1307113 [Mycena polygramma]